MPMATVFESVRPAESMTLYVKASAPHSLADGVNVTEVEEVGAAQLGSVRVPCVGAGASMQYTAVSPASGSLDVSVHVAAVSSVAACGPRVADGASGVGLTVMDTVPFVSGFRLSV